MVVHHMGSLAPAPELPFSPETLGTHAPLPSSPGQRSNRVLLATAIAAFDSLESGAKDLNIRQTMVWLLSEGAGEQRIQYYDSLGGGGMDVLNRLFGWLPRWGDAS